MARMVPAVIDAAKAPPGEVLLFEQLRDRCPADWIALHSLDLPAHVRQVEGELDFLVLVPGHAVICLEVKSHERVARDPNGLWRLGTDEPTARSPFRQASEQMHSLRKRLGTIASLATVPFVSAVAFPRCRFEVTPTEWEPWQALDETLITKAGLANALLYVARQFRDKLGRTPTAAWFRPEQREPTSEQCERILTECRPAFERARSPKARRAEALGEIRRYTDEQLEALDELEDNPRLIVDGAAGTGKTFLAIEAARRAAVRGERALLCCYNRLLGKWLRSEAAPLAPRVWSGTLHALMREITGYTPPDPAPSQYWAEKLPELTTEHLLEGHELAGSFDLVVMDEAQDLATPPFLDVIDLLLAGGLRGGRMMAFGDFAHQAIYTGGDGRAVLQQRAPSATFRLRTNCRNRPRIGTLIASASGANPYRRFRRPDDGMSVTISKFSDLHEETALLAAAIDRYRAEGYRLGDIAVLSMVSTGAPAALGNPHAAWLVPAAVDGPADRIQTATVHAFKGLEALAVIVTDIVDLTAVWQKQLLYTAASRATDRLTLLVHSGATAQLAELITGGAHH